MSDDKEKAHEGLKVADLQKAILRQIELLCNWNEANPGNCEQVRKNIEAIIVAASWITG